MKIICLANSHKHNGRCIAGIDENGRWVRPVPSSQKRAIDKETRIIDGAEPQILDVLEIPLHAHGPVEGCQPENKLLKPGRWKRIGRIKPEDLLRYRPRRFCDTSQQPRSRSSQLFQNDTKSCLEILAAHS